MAKRKPLDTYTCNWFMRRIRSLERGHRSDAIACERTGDVEGAERARDKAFTVGLLGDFAAHDARALKPAKRTKR